MPEPRPQLRPEPRAQPVVHPVPLDPRGLRGSTRGQAAGPRWRRTSRGLYVPASVDPTLPEQRIAECAPLVPDGGALTGWAALRAYGAEFFDGLDRDGRTPLPVPVVLPPETHRATQPGVTWLRDHLHADERARALAMPVTSVERAVLDAVRAAPDLREAVVAVDMACTAELTSLLRLRRFLPGHAGRRGVRRARAALALAHEQSKSPQETRLRLIWLLDAELPAPLVNVAVYDRRGRLLGYPDLLDPRLGHAVEFDGADHRRAARHRSDVDREDRMRRHGLHLTRVTGPDLPRPGGPGPQVVVRRLLEGRALAREIPASRRTWTLTAPDDDPGLSLDELLTLRELHRRAHER